MVMVQKREERPNHSLTVTEDEGGSCRQSSFPFRARFYILAKHSIQPGGAF